MFIREKEKKNQQPTLKNRAKGKTEKSTEKRKSHEHASTEDKTWGQIKQLEEEVQDQLSASTHLA